MLQGDEHVDWRPHHSRAGIAVTVPRVQAAATLLVIERHRDDASTTLVLRGEIDLATAAQFEHELLDAARARPPRIVVDLAGVDFIDCTALRALTQARKRADRNGHSLILQHVPSQAERLFKLTGATETFRTE